MCRWWGCSRQADWRQGVFGDCTAPCVPNSTVASTAEISHNNYIKTQLYLVKYAVFILQGRWNNADWGNIDPRFKLADIFSAERGLWNKSIVHYIQYIGKEVQGREWHCWVEYPPPHTHTQTNKVLPFYCSIWTPQILSSFFEINPGAVAVNIFETKTVIWWKIHV